MYFSKLSEDFESSEVMKAALKIGWCCVKKF